MKRLRALLPDFLAVLGATALLYGLWTIYRPLTFVVGGLLAIAGAVALGVIEERKEPPE